MKKIAAFTLFLLLAAPLIADNHKDNRNLMLNAESATTPREINIGLPSDGGAAIASEGFWHAHGIPSGIHHWAGGNAYEPVGSIPLMEAVLRMGEFGHMVDSHSRFGTDSLSGAVTAASSVNGLIRLDAAASGPLGKGWNFSLGAYANYDPTSVNSPSRLFVDQKQVYQAALTKRWSGDESLSLLYRFSFSADNAGGGYSVAPFVYNGDGSIGLLDGFRLGRDCYMPGDESAQWMDLYSGEMKSGDMSKLDHRAFHDVFLLYKRLTESGWSLQAGAHVCRMMPSTSIELSLAGIDNVTGAHGFSLPGGSPFTGLVQNRLAMMYDARTLASPAPRASSK